MASKSTEITRRYQNKVGMIAKSYKLKKTIVDEFGAACQKVGRSQASVLTEFMQKFTEEVNESEESNEE